MRRCVSPLCVGSAVGRQVMAGGQVAPELLRRGNAVGLFPEAALLSLPMLPLHFYCMLVKEPATEAGALSTRLKSDTKRKHCAQKTAHTHTHVHIRRHITLPAKLCYLESI